LFYYHLKVAQAFKPVLTISRIQPWKAVLPFLPCFQQEDAGAGLVEGEANAGEVVAEAAAGVGVGDGVAACAIAANCMWD